MKWTGSKESKQRTWDEWAIWECEENAEYLRALGNCRIVLHNKNKGLTMNEVMIKWTVAPTWGFFFFNYMKPSNKCVCFRSLYNHKIKWKAVTRSRFLLLGLCLLYRLSPFYFFKYVHYRCLSSLVNLLEIITVYHSTCFIYACTINHNPTNAC